MKNSFFLPFILLSSFSVFSQALSNIGTRQEFAGIVKGSINTFQTYSSGQVNGSQFFIPDWKPGEIISTKKEVFNNGLQIVFDKVRQEVFIREKNSDVILLGEKDEIYSFSLKDGDSVYHFINSSLFSHDKPEVFYQVLVYDSSGLSLFKYTRTSFVRANPTDMMRQREGDIYDAFVDHYIYYLSKAEGTVLPVELKTKSEKNIFTLLNLDPEKYMKEHYEKPDEDYLKNMVEFFNDKSSRK
jgi:hypothetical protein